MFLTSCTNRAKVPEPDYQGYESFGDYVPVAPDYYYRYSPTVPYGVIYPPPGRRKHLRLHKYHPPIYREEDQYYVPPNNIYKNQ